MALEVSTGGFYSTKLECREWTGQLRALVSSRKSEIKMINGPGSSLPTMKKDKFNKAPGFTLKLVINSAELISKN